MNGMLSQNEINMLLTLTGSEDCDNEVLKDDLFELPIKCYRSFNLHSREGFIMMDNLLLPELKKLHEILRQEEAMLSPEDKKAGHTEFVKHCEEILRYSNVARKEGLISLEEVAIEKEKDPEGGFDKELIQMVVNGCDPEVVKRVILLKYFSSEQTVIEKIKNRFLNKKIKNLLLHNFSIIFFLMHITNTANNNIISVVRLSTHI